MAQKMTMRDKLAILERGLIPSLSKSVDEALACLTQAREDYIKLHNIDYDPQSIKKDPIYSVIDGVVRIEMAQTELNHIKKLLGE